MKKPLTNRKWRINLVVSYYNQNIAEINRKNVTEFLKNLSSIYKLDYAISENHKFNNDKDFDISHSNTECDIFYFRSNKNTQIKARELRTTIDSLFPYTYGAYYDGVEFFMQMSKALKEHPFPKEFYRPLKYPFVELYSGSEAKLMISFEKVLEVIEKEQDFSQN